MEEDKKEYKKVSLEESIREFEEDLIRIRQNRLYQVILNTVEKPLIEMVLERTFGNQLKAAKILGINRNTLRAKIKKLGIDIKNYKF